MENKKGYSVKECIAAKAQYEENWDKLFSFITKEQLTDSLLWELLIRQYAIKADDLDEGWRGEYWGKLMRGGAMIYAYSNDQVLYNALVDAVEGMLAMQEESGRISAYSAGREFIGWDMWSRKYIMLGMQYFYDICKEDALKEKIVCALKKHADYIMAHVGNGEGKIPVRKTSDYHFGYNAFSILQPFVKLYALTGEEKYLAYAKEMVEEEYMQGGLFALAKENKLAPHEYPVKKAYEMMSCFEGLVEYYEVVGDKVYLETAKNFADRILQTDFAIIGGCGGHDEYFDNSTKTQVLKTEVNKFETCVTVTLMKYIGTLYRLTGEKRYLDAIERSFYNAYLGALIDVKNVGGLAVPLFYSYSPVYQNERWTLMGGGKNISSYARFGCCIAIGAAGLGVIPTVGVVEEKDSIVIGMFIAGEYVLSNATIRIQTDYPYQGCVKISVTKANEKKKIALRIPDWCENFSMSKEYVVENGFAWVELSENEEIEYTMDMPYKVLSSKTVNADAEELFAVTKGPIVLCADSRETDIYKKYTLAMEEGYAVGVKTEEGYALKLADGSFLPMKEYRKTGKDYYAPYEVSVWLKG